MKMTKVHKRRLQEGRRRYQEQRSLLVKQKAKTLRMEGVKDVGKLTKRELFIAGVVLYWAEGFKHEDESRLGLATSDPFMAKFYIYWLKACLNIPNERLTLRATANISHKYRIDDIEQFWSEFLRIPLRQFTKPFFQKTKWKKQYGNKSDYYGVIRIHVSKSQDLLRKMRGWLKGVKQVVGE